MGVPLVSVVLPTYNRARWIARAVESVLQQSYRRVEVLVVDDGSSDDTRHVLERFESQITLLHQPHAGVYAARNAALGHASGEFVAFIDSDDIWHPDRLASQVPLMRRPEVGLVFGDARIVNGSLHGNGRLRTCFEITPPRRGRVAHHFVWGNFVPTITVLARRACLEEIGGFPTSHGLSADYLTWFRIAVRHELDYAERAIATYTVHDEGVSSHLGAALQARIELFSSELAGTHDRDQLSVLEHLIFNLGVHLSFAIARGRARRRRGALRSAGAALAVAGPRSAGPWTFAFAKHHISARGRRKRDRWSRMQTYFQTGV